MSPFDLGRLFHAQKMVVFVALLYSFDLIFGRGNKSKRYVRNIVYTHCEIKSYPTNICTTFTNRVGTWRS